MWRLVLLLLVGFCVGAEGGPAAEHDLVHPGFFRGEILAIVELAVGGSWLLAVRCGHSRGVIAAGLGGAGDAFELAALVRHSEDAIFKPSRPIAERFPRVAAPELVFVEGAAEGVGPEVEDGDVVLGGGVARFENAGGEVAGGDDQADDGFGLEDVGYVAGLYTGQLV